MALFRRPAATLVGIIDLGSGSFLDNFPGRPTNPVGFAVAPGFSSLTAWPGGTGGQLITDGTHAQSGAGTALNPWVFSFYDFDSLSSSVNFGLAHAKFIGCRFQSNNSTAFNTNTINGTPSQDLTFSYCTWSPRAALVAAPPGSMWPSAGVAQDVVSGGNSIMTDGVDCTPGNSGYQHGFYLFNTSDGPFTWDHCDFWGMGNDAISFTAATTAQMTVRDCWIHDSCNFSPQSYHGDGLGYLDSGAAPSNILVDHCTIASIATQNGIAFQATSTNYQNIIAQRSFLSGFSVIADMCNNTAGSAGCAFTDNVFGTDIQYSNNIHGDNGSIWVSPTNVWRRNKFRVLAGTHVGSGTQFSWTSADDGKFVVPTAGKLSATDYTG